MSEQLVFELPHRPALGADDFLVSVSNEVAVRLVDAWPDWPNPVHAIVGPAGCGKTHLANVWGLKSGALRPEGTLPDISALEAAPGGGLILEDLDRIPYDAKALFHLFNLAGELELSILLTARTAPAGWPVKLPDLKSRLRSLPSVEVGAPDDVLLRAVLVKQFADRQLDVEPRVIAFLATRMERSMEAAQHLVAAIDRAALAAGRSITRALAGEVLERLQAGRRDDL